MVVAMLDRFDSGWWMEKGFELVCVVVGVSGLAVELEVLVAEKRKEER
jgi:hypothetical protein